MKLALQRADLLTVAAPFVACGVLSTDALNVVDALARRWFEPNPHTLLALACVVEAQLRGHAGLDLRAVERVLLARADLEGDEARSTPTRPPWPADLLGWEANVLTSPLVSTSGPFVGTPLDNGGILLQSLRMAWEEDRVAQALRALALEPPGGPNALLLDADEVNAACARLLAGEVPGSPAERALRCAASRRLTIVTGGPGTGKTWSIKRVLAMLLEAAARRAHPLRIVLTAPTGKAGVRMREAMGEDIHALQTTPEARRMLQALPASTLHRLLRIQPGSGASRFGPESPLPTDVVVLDEASMVDLPLMRRLLTSLGPATRLVLLGDRDQLPSVDVGSVLGDLVSRPLDAQQGARPDAGPLGECVVRFAQNHRSGAAPALAELVSTLQAPDSPAARARAGDLLTGAAAAVPDPHPSRLLHLGEAREGRPTPEQLDALLTPWLCDSLAHGQSEGYLSMLRRLLASGGRAALTDSAHDLLAAFDRYRVLAVHRRGPLGVDGLTRALSRRFKQHILESDIARPVTDAGANADAVRATRRRRGLLTQSGLWLGQPVLVTENAYEVNLWNGDIGLVLPSATSARALECVFPATEPSDASAPAPLRRVALSRLPPHADGLVLTVHKSQGSQFNHVALVLADRASPIQTRELVYTGLTRASERVTWLGRADLLQGALGVRVVRGSALALRLGD